MAKMRATAPVDHFPIRGVTIWPNAFDLAIYPYLANWQLCDGGGGSPDYRDHHVRGALLDVLVGNVVGADTHLHANTAVATNAGAHTHVIDAVDDHNHTIAEYCHDHEVPAGTDGCCNGIAPCALCSSYSDQFSLYIHTHTMDDEDSHNHCSDVVGEIGYTGDDGGHTHTEQAAGDHTHAITVTPVLANGVPLTRLCHFIQKVA